MRQDCPVRRRAAQSHDPVHHVGASVGPHKKGRRGKGASARTRDPLIFVRGKEIMAKGQEKKKMEKKEPAKTFKEKREAKKTKKEEKKR